MIFSCFILCTLSTIYSPEYFAGYCSNIYNTRLSGTPNPCWTFFKSYICIFDHFPTLRWRRVITNLPHGKQELVNPAYSTLWLLMTWPGGSMWLYLKCGHYTCNHYKDSIHTLSYLFVGVLAGCCMKVQYTPYHIVCFHYDDVIMSTITSQITSLTVVYSIIYSGADQSKHQSSASLAFVWGIHQWPMNSPHKWPVTRKIFPFDDVIMLFSCRYNLVFSGFTCLFNHVI